MMFYHPRFYYCSQNFLIFSSNLLWLLVNLHLKDHLPRIGEQGSDPTIFSRCFEKYSIIVLRLIEQGSAIRSIGLLVHDLCSITFASLVDLESFFSLIFLSLLILWSKIIYCTSVSCTIFKLPMVNKDLLLLIIYITSWIVSFTVTVNLVCITCFNFATSIKNRPK